jgi:hypothetical protein
VLRYKESKEGILLSLKEERTSSSSKWKNNPTTRNSWRPYYPAGRQRSYNFWGCTTTCRPYNNKYEFRQSYTRVSSVEFLAGPEQLGFVVI